MFRILVRLVLLGLFVVLPVSLAFLYFYGVPSPLTRQVARALSGPDYLISMGRLSLHPLRGPVAEEVVVLDRRRTPLLQLDRLAVTLNLSALLHRRIQVEALELDRASLRLPMADGNAVHLSDASARLLLPPGKLRISRAEATLEGWRISVRGTLLHPQRFDPSTFGAGGGTTKGAELIGRVLDILRETRHPLSSPRLSIVLSGDLSDPTSIQADSIALQADDLHWRELYFSKLRVNAFYREQVVTLTSAEARLDRGGVLIAQGFFAEKNRSGEVFLQGKFDPAPWLRSFDREDLLPQVYFNEPLGLFLHARLNSLETGMQEDAMEPSLQAMGRLEVENFTVRGVPVDFFAAEFAWQPGLFLTRGARVVGPAVNATLDVRLLDQTASVRTDGFFTPTLCLPWLDQGMQRVVSQMEFDEPAEASLALEIPLQDSGALTGTGQLRLGRTAMRGEWIDGGSCDLILGDRAVRYENLSLQMNGGQGTGVFVYDFGRREVRLENIESTVPPEGILQWIDPRIAHAAQPYRFRGRPDVRGGGLVDMADPEKTRLDLTISASGMNYKLLGQELSFGPVRGKLSVRGRSLQATVERAELFGGEVRLETRVSLDRTRPEYELSVDLQNVDFATINRLYFGYEGSEGLLSGELTYTAEFARQSELVGQGRIRVENGNVFAIPILGPLSPILNSIVPGSGYQIARLATADFTIANETIQTNNLEIVGAGFSLYGQGDIYFVADELDMNVRMNAQGAPGLLLLPVSKMFEYSSSGTLSDPVWRPRHLPREVYGEGLVETVTSPVRQLLGVENSAEENMDTDESTAPNGPSGNGKPRKRIR